MQGRFKMEYRLFTIVRYNYNYRDYNNNIDQLKGLVVVVGKLDPLVLANQGPRPREPTPFPV